MNGLHAGGYQSALKAAEEQFQVDMAHLKVALVRAGSTEAEEAIVQQMREREAKQRDLLASLQRSLF
ncbi:hypothetical protein [Blastopirellula marina]|uniref:Uncharacterized protein n=1 Tax=Blastopirellula marina TaxID=124 RepID=A0A2S8GPH1_9BACT|nr:hypothetical protein [Blastopirellula marina]PQO46251.1 hypothetical protein C5Y93_09705 [Blastopirellula marina]